MHRVEFHKKAEKSLKKMPQNRAQQILKAVRELAEMTDPSDHHQVIAMQGNWLGHWRMRVGSYRVIFRLIQEGDSEILLVWVNHVGPRGGIYG